MNQRNLHRTAWTGRWRHDVIDVEGQPYLRRWSLRLPGGWSIRLHRFYRGDVSRAMHTHPFWFITLPLSPYVEEVMDDLGRIYIRIVRRLIPQYRSLTFKHRVIGSLSGGPWWTIVLTGPGAQTWGFLDEQSS